MAVLASPVSSIFDAANTVVLRERGLFEVLDHHEPGVQVPRRGTPFWETSGDFDWKFRVIYDTQGAGPYAVEIWAANGPDVADTCVATVSIPANTRGEVIGVVCAESLRAISTGEPLFLSCKLLVGSGMLDAGVELARAT